MLRPIIVCFLLCINLSLAAQTSSTPFRVIAFYTGEHDQAHISFIKEANEWFPTIASKNGFTYESTRDWTNMNDSFLSRYQVVIFLDTRPATPAARAAFQRYMEKGGAWMGFHFSAFALTPSAYPQDWDWYYQTFLGSGSYKSNTWRPTAAVLKNEMPTHPVLAGLPDTFRTAPNEWYRWENDLRKNPAIRVLLSIDASSFPLGTGPKQHEIWHSGDYPVAWTNTHYHMVYFNMGHNDIDYEHKTNATLSYTFSNAMQNQVIVNSFRWLGRSSGTPQTLKEKEMND